MKKITDAMKRKMAMLSLALSNVEKNALGQDTNGLLSDTSHTKRMTQGTLADSLINAEVTEEVQNLRWRTYKILNAANAYTTKIVGYDDDGLPITKLSKKDITSSLQKIKVDTHDDYPLMLVLDNSDITLSLTDGMSNSHLTINDDVKNLKLDKKNPDSVSTGEKINGEEYFATNKSERPLVISRNNPPNFYIENFTTKLNVRKINETQNLLEFYVSSYPDEYNRTSRLFLSGVKKAIEKPYSASMLDIDKVYFITNKTIGVDDLLEFEYKIDKFDKIIEFNGHYVIKFIATPIKNGVSIFDQYIVDELETKYKNKEKK